MPQETLSKQVKIDLDKLEATIDTTKTSSPFDIDLDRLEASTYFQDLKEEEDKKREADKRPAYEFSGKEYTGAPKEVEQGIFNATKSFGRELINFASGLVESIPYTLYQLPSKISLQGVEESLGITLDVSYQNLRPLFPLLL